MTQSNAARAWALGGTVFAGVTMIIIGVFQLLQGLAGIIRDEFFVVSGEYAYEIDTTIYGWIHLGIGALLLLTGIFLFTGALWARVIGITVAAISAIANFFFVPYYPLWSLLIIALDIFAIWAIANVNRQAIAEWSGAGGTEAGYFAGEPAQSRDRWPATAQPAGRHAAAEPSAETRSAQGVTTGPAAGSSAPPNRPPAAPPNG